MSFNIGLSGLNAASKALNVTGNNIANVSSTGFKSSRAEFADMYASSFFGTGKNAVGSGVVTADIAQQFTQGNITATGNTMDMAISGNGFFVLDHSGSSLYTRNGSFTVDNSGYITDSSGNKLQGYGVDGNGNIINGPLTDLQISSDSQMASPTTKIDQTTSLDSSSDIVTSTTFDPADAESYNWSTSADVYDSQGNSHTMTQYFAKTASNAWTMYVTIDGRNPANPSLTTPAAIDFSFDNSGQLSATAASAASNVDATSITATAGATAGDLTLTSWVPAEYDQNTNRWVANGAGPSAAGIAINMENTTQTNTSFAVTSLTSDGYTTGLMSGLSVSSDGTLFATYTNGQSQVIGQVAFANFTNAQGLRPVGNSNWAETLDSGQPTIGAPGTGTLGTLASESLEDSNVDLTSELVNLIVEQRNYQANAKTISTENTISQTIIQMT